MRGEQATLLARVLVAIGQPLQERPEAARRIAGLGGEAEAVVIRFQLLAAAEALERDAGHLVDEAGGDVAALAAGRGRRVDEAGLRQRLDRVVLDDVGQLMAEHAGQLRFVGDERQAALGDVHVAAGRGEGVDRVGVEHDEPPRIVGLLADPGQHGPDQRDVAVHRRILGDAEFLADVGADLGAELLLLGLGVDGVVGLLGHRQALADLVELRRGRRGQHDGGDQRHQKPCRQTLHLYIHLATGPIGPAGRRQQPRRPAPEGPAPAPRRSRRRCSCP